MQEKKLIEAMVFDEPEQPALSQSEQGQLQKAMDFDVKTKSIEEKIYIILYKLTENEDEVYNQVFSICVGRTEAYTDIKNKLISGLDVDLHRSIIITETKQTETSSRDRKYFLLPLNECISVYAFCVQVAEFYSDDNFNIEDYNNTLIDNETNSSNLAEQHSIIPRQLSQEELDYKKMLDASIQRDKFLDSLHREQEGSNNI